MLRFYQHTRLCNNYCNKVFGRSVLRDISIYQSRCSSSGFQGVLHQICRNLSTGKKIDASASDADKNNGLNDPDKIKKTCLYEFHVSHGGKMVDFAGYSLPIQYGKQGIAASHKHTRLVKMKCQNTFCIKMPVSFPKNYIIYNYNTKKVLYCRNGTQKPIVWTKKS